MGATGFSSDRRAGRRCRRSWRRPRGAATMRTRYGGSSALRASSLLSCLLVLLSAQTCSAGAPTRNCTASNTGCSSYCREREGIVPPTFKHCRLCRCRACDVCMLAWADGFIPWAPTASSKTSSRHHASFLTRVVRPPSPSRARPLLSDAPLQVRSAAKRTIRTTTPKGTSKSKGTRAVPGFAGLGECRPGSACCVRHPRAPSCLAAGQHPLLPRNTPRLA